MLSSFCKSGERLVFTRWACLQRGVATTVLMEVGVVTIVLIEVGVVTTVLMEVGVVCCLVSSFRSKM